MSLCGIICKRLKCHRVSNNYGEFQRVTAKNGKARVSNYFQRIFPPKIIGIFSDGKCPRVNFRSSNDDNTCKWECRKWIQSSASTLQNTFEKWALHSAARKTCFYELIKEFSSFKSSRWKDANRFSIWNVKRFLRGWNALNAKNKKRAALNATCFWNVCVRYFSH